MPTPQLRVIAITTRMAQIEVPAASKKLMSAAKLAAPAKSTMMSAIAGRVRCRSRCKESSLAFGGTSAVAHYCNSPGSRPDERSVVVRNRTDARRRYFRLRNLNVVRSAALLAPVVAIVCCVLRRNKFRFGHAVQAIQGDLLDVDVLADHVGGAAAGAQSQSHPKT
jgi:hypothetical protein